MGDIDQYEGWILGELMVKQPQMNHGLKGAFTEMFIQEMNVAALYEKCISSLIEKGYIELSGTPAVIKRVG